MYGADDTYSVRSTWSCSWLDQFLIQGNSAWSLSKISISYWIRLTFILLALMGVEIILCLAATLSYHGLLMVWNPVGLVNP